MKIAPFGRGKGKYDNYNSYTFYKKVTAKKVRQAERMACKKAFKVEEVDDVEVPVVSIGYFS